MQRLQRFSRAAPNPLQSFKKKEDALSRIRTKGAGLESEPELAKLYKQKNEVPNQIACLACHPRSSRLEEEV